MLSKNALIWKIFERKNIPIEIIRHDTYTYGVSYVV